MVAVKVVSSGGWAYNQFESICVLVDLLIGDCCLIMASSPFWAPQISQGLLLHMQAVCLFYQSNLQERWSPMTSILAHPAFSFLLYQLCTPVPAPNNPLSPKIWRASCQVRLEPHHTPHLSWGTCRAGIRSCRLP